MDRVEIKKKAKEIAFNNLWNVWKPILIVGVISGVLSFIVTLIFGGEGILASLFSFIVTLIMLPASVGTNKCILDISRGETPTLDSLRVCKKFCVNGIYP